MSVIQMRDILKTRTKYKHSSKWHAKVDAMSDNQVMAVYFRMRNNSELE
jgi:hypothetical protein